MIYNGDCLELMKLIPDRSVDMVLTDLPYGTTDNKWDIQLDLNQLWKQYKRVCKDNAPILLFSQLPFAVDLVNSNRAWYRYEWIYQKTLPVGFLNAKKMPLRVHENILVFYKKLPTYNPIMRPGQPYHKTASKDIGSNYKKHKPVIKHSDGGRYPIDVLTYSTGNHAKKYHPTEKPIALLEYLIKTYTNKGETVLDSCMGAGGTGVACMNTGRKFIGMELDVNYYNIAFMRITEAQNAICGKFKAG